MKRFYKTVSAVAADGGGAIILLDGRTLRTPAKSEMRLPTIELAEAIAREWDAQNPDIKPLQMPLTRLAATAIDRVAADREATVADIIRYGDTDLLSYRAGSPDELVALQDRHWTPLLDWFRERFDIHLQVTDGLMAIAQSPDLSQRLRQICEALDPVLLTALHAMTTITGSIVIGLALLEGRLTAGAAHEAWLVDETFQAQRWGEDEEAAGRRQAMRDELEAVERFVRLRKAFDRADLHR